MQASPIQTSMSVRRHAQDAYFIRVASSYSKSGLPISTPVKPSLGQSSITHTGAAPSSSVSTISEPLPLPAGSLASLKSSLSILPLSCIVRSLLITSISSYPRLLDSSLALLNLVTRTKLAILDADRNPIIKYVLGRTVYDQFCAGETPAQINRTIQNLRDRGFAGAVLGYAKEVVLADDEAVGMNSLVTKTGETTRDIMEINTWKNNQIKTINLAGRGNVVNVKWTGAGSLTLERMLKEIREYRSSSTQSNKRFKTRLTHGQLISCAMDRPGLPVIVYNTYQAYLRSVPSTVAKHLHLAETEGWVLGVKLVRGAYLNSDPRHLIWATKEETNRSYDGVAEALITQSYNDVVQPIASKNESGTTSSFGSGGSTSFPEVNLVLASHNRDSVLKARTLRNKQMQNGEKMIRMAYGQLYGMADDISCALIHGDSNTQAQAEAGLKVEKPRVFKAVIWGNMQDCAEYLLRRGHENRDAASRTADTRNAMAAELRRRVFRL
ncbi:proline oxidase PrnD [Ascosphaera apis ARSEF 7405]|uniref:Proline dehydrogenase n=1 Tax=Ascosphaera apis ARSEF 7405 TaxID=392613 RepID=A0A167WAK2_9EURO|nr:proline oxidase PrnD [Ascosphaera apis ARSEF 7405]